MYSLERKGYKIPRMSVASYKYELLIDYHLLGLRSALR